MDFTFSEEQQQFADALRRYLGQRYGFETRQAIVASREGVSDEQWRAFAELGLTALPVPEASGGLGGGALDMLVAMAGAGRRTGGRAVLGDGGRCRGAAARGQRASSRSSAAGTRGRRRGAPGGCLRRTRRALRAARHRFACGAGRRRLPAQRQQGAGSPRRPGAGLDRAGPAARWRDRVVPGRARCRRCPMSRITEPSTASARRRCVSRARPRAGSSTAAAVPKRWNGSPITVSCCSVPRRSARWTRSIRATLDYTRTREQFGTPIARFQVLQHRMVDMLIHTEQAPSLAYLAALRYADDRRQSTAPRGVRRESAGGAGRAFRRAAGDPAAWRDGHDQRGRGGPSVQATVDHRPDARRCRSPHGAICLAAGFFRIRCGPESTQTDRRWV